MNTGTSMNYLALRQAIQGRFMIMGGSEPEETENTEFRTIKWVPVYHISSAQFLLRDLEDRATTNCTFENESWQDEWILSDSIKEAFVEVRGE